MPLRETANHLIDTSNLRPRALQKMLKEIVLNAGSEPPLRVEVLSFGFKRGIPREGDLVFDVRFLPNPFYIPELGSHTGLDQDVKDFVLEHPVTKEFLVKCMDMLQFLLPHYITEGKHRLVIAIGCTGGAHRSVAIAEYISARLEELGYHTTVSYTHLECFRPSDGSSSESRGRRPRFPSWKCGCSAGRTFWQRSCAPSVPPRGSRGGSPRSHIPPDGCLLYTSRCV